MSFNDLPVDIVANIVDELVLSCNLRDGLQLRCVNHVFNCEILRAYFTSAVVDFHPKSQSTDDHSAEAKLIRLNSPNHQARSMSKAHAVRLLCGRLEALPAYGSDLPWLYKLETAVQLLERTSTSSISPMKASKEDTTHREAKQQVGGAVTDYLGVAEVIDSLDATKQDLCCRYHYLTCPGNVGCWGPKLEASKRFRRTESALDWAILTALSMADFAAVPALLRSQRCQNDPILQLPASLQYCASHNFVKLFRLLLDAGGDINCHGHTSADLENEYSEILFGSPLQAACAAGSIRIVKLCLIPDYELKLCENDYQSALRSAARLEDHELGLEIVKSLTSTTSSWFGSSGTAEDISLITCQNGNVELGKYAYEIKPFDLNAYCRPQHSRLFQAVEHGHADVVEYLTIKHRECLQTFPHRNGSWNRERELRMAMRCAARYGRTHIASLLWPEFESWGIGGLLSYAAKNGHVEIIQFLLSKGLDLSKEMKATDELEARSAGQDALYRAVRHGQVSTAAFLLGLGIEPLVLKPSSRM